MAPPIIPIGERLARLTDQRGPEECWLWLGAIQAKGYGVIGAGGKYGSNRYVHRVAYELAYGPIPPGLHIDHRCHGADDSCAGGRLCVHRRCVNPSHLEAVTPVENARRSLQPTLTIDDVRTIRAALSRGELQRVLAERYAVDPSEISRIKTGSIWREEARV